jgi:D-alanine-D-alanine ligase
MDKVRAKQVWQSSGLPTPAYTAFTRGDSIERALAAVTFPVIVKPAREGSSLGVTRADAPAACRAALEHALEFDDDVLIEQWIAGGEYTLGIVDGEPLPLIRLETPREFYDYEAKYHLDTTLYHCPCGLAQERIAQLTELGLRAFKALGASGWGRVDFMLDADEKPWLIELNTVPGMTDHSLVPMAAAALGIGFDELVINILATTIAESR